MVLADTQTYRLWNSQSCKHGVTSVQSLTGTRTNACMLVYHTIGHIMSMANCGDCVEATMMAEVIQIEETDIEVVKDNDQPSKSNTSKKSSQTRRAFHREFKLRVIKDFYQDGKNISRTARKFAVDRKQVHLWVQKEEKITKQKSRSKADGRGCNTRCPFMEDKLYKESLDLRKEGQKVKRGWFDNRPKQLMNELYPDVKDFQYSDK